MKQLNELELINVNGGASGYVYSKYLDFDSVDRSADGFATVSLGNPSSHLNVREEPSTSANIVGSLDNGTEVSTHMTMADRKNPAMKSWTHISY